MRDRNEFTLRRERYMGADEQTEFSGYGDYDDYGDYADFDAGASPFVEDDRHYLDGKSKKRRRGR